MGKFSASFRDGLGLLATLLGIASAAWQVTQIGWSWPWSLLALAFVCMALLLLIQPDTVSLKFRVQQVCRNIKAEAGHTVDIAAGDCSWLAKELPKLTKRMDDDGITIRLLCLPGPSPALREHIQQFANHSNTNVRIYDGVSFLRCIIADRDRELHPALLLIESNRSAQAILDWIRVPRFLRRDHRATPVQPGSRLYQLVCTAYDSLFEDGKPF